jgi:uncharacterized protein (DUF1810 family)
MQTTYFMTEANNLNRFIEAQAKNYTDALAEIKNGKKRSHWMWYVFPQIKGLGFSETARYYSINDVDEANDYINHPILGSRLIEISKALLNLDSDNANAILGSPDDVKLKSSMTLFAALPNANPVFESVLQKFFNGEKDDKTVKIIAK